MCLTVLPACKPEIAQEDITCWKVIKPLDNYKWKALYRGTVHNYDEVLTACDRLNVEPWYSTYYAIPNYDIIKEGFHAYTNENKARYIADYHSCIIVECTIPAGAGYCLGAYEEIVANKMIVHKPNESKK